MYALFLETKAARQIEDYAKQEELGQEWVELYQKRAYEEAIAYYSQYNFDPSGRTKEEVYSNYLVSKCLKEDSHKEIDIDQLFTWHLSKEGANFWEKIQGW